MSTGLPPGVPPGTKVFGPGANCTLEFCPIEISVYGYRPSLAANITFLCLYIVTATIHIYLGMRWRTWFFMGCMVFGAGNAVMGYAGRIAMWYNPFNFVAFMVQIGWVTLFCSRYLRCCSVTIELYARSNLTGNAPGNRPWLTVVLHSVCITSGPVYYSASIYVTLAAA